MEATRRMEIELPEELADFVRADVESGRFVDESEAVASALELMREHDEDADDPEVEAWLRTVVAPRLQALDEGRARTKSLDEARASLAARRTERDRAA